MVDQNPAQVWLNQVIETPSIRIKGLLTRIIIYGVDLRTTI